MTILNVVPPLTSSQPGTEAASCHLGYCDLLLPTPIRQANSPKNPLYGGLSGSREHANTRLVVSMVALDAVVGKYPVLLVAVDGGWFSVIGGQR